MGWTQEWEATVEYWAGRREALVAGRAIQLLESERFCRAVYRDLHRCDYDAKPVDGTNPQPDASASAGEPGRNLA